MLKMLAAVLIGSLSGVHAGAEVLLMADPASLPRGWSTVDSGNAALPGQSPRKLIFDEAINDVPVADVSVRTYRPPTAGMPAKAPDWVRAMFGYKHKKAKGDWAGVKDARFVERDGMRILRAELTVPSVLAFGPPTDHQVAIFAVELDGRVLVLDYNRTTATYRYGFKPVETLFDQVRPMIKPTR